MARKKECPFCANEVLEKAIKCQFCQSEIEPGVCVACKRKNRVEAAFCGHCGSDKVIHPAGWRRAGESPADAVAQKRRAPVSGGLGSAGDRADSGGQSPSHPGQAKSHWGLAAAGLAVVCLLGFYLARSGRELSGPPSAAKPEPAIPARTAASAGEDMALVPAGEFWMGSAEGEGQDDERPRHKVYLDAYFMDKREVTNGEYMRFVRAAGSHEPEWMEAGSKYNVETGSDDHYRRLGEALKGDSYPVVGVSWHDAQAYCRWAGKRLPTEAEWEKAARGGAETKYHFGNSESELGDYAWYDSNSGGRTHPVGQKKPNQYGLYDMHGNVWEWVADWYDDEYYRHTPERNPTGPSSGSSRGLRGGAWDDGASNGRAARRDWSSPDDRVSGRGFRCVRRQ